MQNINSDIVLVVAQWLSDRDAVMFFVCNRWLWSHCDRHRYREWHEWQRICHTSYYNAFTHVVFASGNPLPALPKACRHIRQIATKRLPYIDFRRGDFEALQSLHLTENFHDICLPEAIKTFSIQRYNSEFKLELPIQLTKLKCEYSFYNQQRDHLPHLSQLKILVAKDSGFSRRKVKKSDRLIFGAGLTHISFRKLDMRDFSDSPICDPKLPQNLQYLSIGRGLDCELSFDTRLPYLTTYIGPYPYHEDFVNLKHLTKLKIRPVVYKSYYFLKPNSSCFGQHGHGLAKLQYLQIHQVDHSLDLARVPALQKLKIKTLRAEILNLATSGLKKLHIDTVEVTIQGLPATLQCLMIKSGLEIYIKSWPPHLRKLRIYPDNRVPSLPTSLQILDINGILFDNFTSQCLPNLRHLTLNGVSGHRKWKFSQSLPAEIVTITCRDCCFTADQISGFENKIRYIHR